MTYTPRFIFLPLLHKVSTLPVASSSFLAARTNPKPFAHLSSVASISTKQMTTAVDHIDTKGAFMRKQSKHRHIVSKKNTEYPPEAGRYHLHIALACPWCVTRCVFVQQHFILHCADTMFTVYVGPTEY
jgi:hypothetical protein